MHAPPAPGVTAASVTRAAPDPREPALTLDGTNPGSGGAHVDALRNDFRA